MRKYNVAAFVWPLYIGDNPRTRISPFDDLFGYGYLEAIKEIF